MKYNIGDKVIYISPFTKPMIGRVIYCVNNNYLIDFSDNTRKWVTEEKLIKFSKENYLKRIVEKYLKGKKCRCIKDYTYSTTAWGMEHNIEIIPANTEFTIDVIYFSLQPYGHTVINVAYVTLCPVNWKPKYEITIIGGTIDVVWEQFAEYFELVK